MSTKEYDVPLPCGVRCHSLNTIFNVSGTPEQIQQIKASCEQALAKAEAEKPQPWDFGIGSRGWLCIRGRDLQGWGGGNSPIDKPPKAHADFAVRVLGNLKEIVEQGPIVVGMPVAVAQRVAGDCEGHGNYVTARNINAALARDEAKP